MKVWTGFQMENKMLDKLEFPVGLALLIYSLYTLIVLLIPF